jgi:hypothetical protein
MLLAEGTEHGKALGKRRHELAIGAAPARRASADLPGLGRRIGDFAVEAMVTASRCDAIHR